MYTSSSWIVVEHTLGAKAPEHAGLRTKVRRKANNQNGFGLIRHYQATTPATRRALVTL